MPIETDGDQSPKPLTGKVKSLRHGCDYTRVLRRVARAIAHREAVWLTIVPAQAETTVKA